MKYSTLKLKELIDKSESKELLLPNFQREYVWERATDQKDLVASILYDIPIGSLLILDGESGFFATKELCVRRQFTDSKRDSTLYLLDGQQRISTIKSIFFDFFSNPETCRENHNNLYPKLRTRWFLRVKPKDESSVDIFGWNNLKFKGISGYSPDIIEEIVEYEVLNINQKEKWFHPEYEKEKWIIDGKINENTRKNLVSKIAGEEGVVPLYTIWNNEEKESATLHYKTLKKIAQERVSGLKSSVDDGILNIDDILDDYDEENLEDSWNALSNDWITDVIKFLNSIMDKEVPVIQLIKDEMSRAIYTFERVNKGGTALSTYDLVVAKSAYNAELSSLTDRIIEIINKEINIPQSILNGLKETANESNWKGSNMDLIKENELTAFIKNQYLNLLSIFSYFEYGKFIRCEGEKKDISISIDYIKKDKQLNLDADKINTNTEITIKCLVRACAFLQFRCGIVKATDLSYQLMLLPIAYMLKNDDVWNDVKAINKIEYWYWSSLFAGSYRAVPNEKCINDIQKLYLFIKENKNEFIERQNKVFKVEDYSNYQTLVFENENKKIPTSVYNGILQYVLSKQPKDFIDDHIYLNAWDISIKKKYVSDIKNKTVELTVQDHHICPLNNATKLGESSKSLRKQTGFILNSPLNRTYISANANSIISDKKPEDYFKYVSDLAKYGHCIPSPIEEKYKQLDNENDHDFYSRVVKQRYDEIIRDLQQELENLKSL